MPLNQSSYPLSHSYLSTTRLIAQHALWQYDLRFLVHPEILDSLSIEGSSDSTLDTPVSPIRSIFTTPPTRASPRNSSPRIADLATGTAIWPLSLLQEYPNAQITASDISLSQLPPREWMPSGLTAQTWNIYDPILEDWAGQFDVVHIRLAILVIKSNDTRTVLDNAWKMLKPGGWMQWDELDPEGAHTIATAAAKVAEEDMRKFQKMQELTDFEGLKWIRGLKGALEDAGFSNVGKVVFEGKRSTVGFFQKLQFMVMEEEGQSRDELTRDSVSRDIEYGNKISDRGLARVVPKIVVWGRKPLVVLKEE